MEADKEKRLILAQTHAKGIEVLNLGKEVAQLKVPELDMVLDMHQVEKKGRGKRSDKVAKVTELWLKPPPLFDVWTDADEARLKELKELKIDIKDTALGRYQAQEKQRIHIAIGNMNDDERGAVLQQIIDIEEKKMAAEQGSGEASQGSGSQAENHISIRRT